MKATTPQKHCRNPSVNPGVKFVEIKRERDKTYLVLAGEWTVRNAGPIEQAVTQTQRELGHGFSEVIAKGIENLDTSGALLLKKLLPEKQLPRNLTETQRGLLEFLPAFSEYKPQDKKEPPAIVRFFSGIGENTLVGFHFLREIFVFIGRISARLGWNFLHPRHFRVPSVVRHIQETGIQALPIIGLLAVLISMVITYQGSIQLRKFGADIYTIDLTAISLLREMGVLVTAIMVAGRSGSAFAAEIGVMKLREEVSALKTMGLDPIEVLVLPRVLALLITLPLLTFLADVIGLAGGGIMSFFLLNASPYQYLTRVQGVADVTTFFIGIIKAPVFAFLIAVIGCYQGLHVTGSAESIGRMTTLSVVQAIFLVIMADAFFSIVFSSVGI
jgi:phospholipid/cholesterol/gamma-HCH transport system permease protein